MNSNSSLKTNLAVYDTFSVGDKVDRIVKFTEFSYGYPASKKIVSYDADCIAWSWNFPKIMVGWSASDRQRATAQIAAELFSRLQARRLTKVVADESLSPLYIHVSGKIGDQSSFWVFNSRLNGFVLKYPKICGIFKPNEEGTALVHDSEIESLLKDAPFAKLTTKVFG